MKSTNLMLLPMLFLAACAHTTFYRDGKRVAHFEADMTNMEFAMYANGEIHWSGNVNHSTPTLAQGKSATDKITAIGGAAAASGIMALLK